MDIPQFISTLVGGHLGSTMDILICVLWQTQVHTSTVYTYRVGLLGNRVCPCSVSVYCKELLKVAIDSTPTRSISEFQLLPTAS